MLNNRDAEPAVLFNSLIASNPRKTDNRLGATATSIVVHAAIVVGLIYMPARAASAIANDSALLISLPEPRIEPLPAPPKLDPPPVQATAALPAGFHTLAVPDVVPAEIPPPQVGVQIRAEDFEPRGIAGGSPDGKADSRVPTDLEAAPFMTPMDVPPKLLNRDAVGDAISRNYPPLMRDAGIGGTTKVWFYIDESGRSVKQVVKTPSGYAVLDSAALRVAPQMRFSPALANGRAIPVWVALDVVFRIR